MKEYTKLFASFLMIVFCISCGQKQTEEKKFIINSKIKSIISSHGPARITRNIIQDKKGNIWIAAFDGIFRYDGKSFTNITSKVSSARFFSVLEDRKNNLWFGSIGSGVYYYDGKSFRNFTTKDGLAGNNVGCIYEDKTGNIWLGTSSGVSCYNGISFKNFTIREGLPNNDVNSIIEDKTGKLWLGTRDYACVYDGNKFTVLIYKENLFKNVRSIIEDKKGNIWLGGVDGLWRYDGNTFTNFTQNFVGHILEDRKGNIWTSSQRPNEGKCILSRYDEKSLTDTKPTVTEIQSKYEGNKGMIFGILEAKDGSIWFGTMVDGVCRYDGKTITNYKEKNSQKI